MKRLTYNHLIAIIPLGFIVAALYVFIVQNFS